MPQHHCLHLLPSCQPWPGVGGSCSCWCRARRGPWCSACKVLPAHIWARVGSLESVSQDFGPASSCSVCASLQGHPSWRWSCCSPGLHTAPAHRGPNNGFIRAEPLSLRCCCFAITPRARAGSSRGPSELRQGLSQGPEHDPPFPRVAKSQDGADADQGVGSEPMASTAASTPAQQRPRRRAGVAGHGSRVPAALDWMPLLGPAAPQGAGISPWSLLSSAGASPRGWGGVGCAGGGEACRGVPAAWGEVGRGLRGCCGGGWQLGVWTFLVLTLSLGQSPRWRVAPGPEQPGWPWHQRELPVPAKQPPGTSAAPSPGAHSYLGRYWQQQPGVLRHCLSVPGGSWHPLCCLVQGLGQGWGAGSSGRVASAPPRPPPSAPSKETRGEGAGFPSMPCLAVAVTTRLCWQPPQAGPAPPLREPQKNDGICSPGSCVGGVGRVRAGLPPRQPGRGRAQRL